MTDPGLRNSMLAAQSMMFFIGRANTRLRVLSGDPFKAMRCLAVQDLDKSSPDTAWRTVVDNVRIARRGSTMTKLVEVTHSPAEKLTMSFAKERDNRFC